MKKIFLRTKVTFTIMVAGSFLLLLTSCDSHLPRPAISFTDSSAALEHAEKNKFLNKDVVRDDPTISPDAMGYKLQWETFKYLFNGKDTITYFFIKQQVYDVLVQIPDITLDELSKRIEKEFHVTSKADGIFEAHDFYIRIGKDGKNKGCYILYFYPCEEIKEAITSLLHPDPMFATSHNLEKITGNQFALSTMLYLEGRADAGGPVDYYTKLLYIPEQSFE